MTVTFDTAAFEADLLAIKLDIERNATVATKNAIHEAATASNEHGYQNKTGELTGHRDEVVMRSPAGISGYIRWNANHAKWVDDGRGEVRPINAKFLRYYIGSRVIFSKYSKPSRPAKFSERARMVLEVTSSVSLQDGIDSAIQAHP